MLLRHVFSIMYMCIYATTNRVRNLIQVYVIGLSVILMLLEIRIQRCSLLVGLLRDHFGTATYWGDRKIKLTKLYICRESGNRLRGVGKSQSNESLSLGRRRRIMNKKNKKGNKKIGFSTKVTQTKV